MGYQDVKTPRFYCNVLEFLHTVGKIDLNYDEDNQVAVDGSRVMTLPVLTDNEESYAPQKYTYGMMGIKNNNFIASLNIPVGGKINVGVGNQTEDAISHQTSSIIDVLGDSEHAGVRIRTFENFDANPEYDDNDHLLGYKIIWTNDSSNLAQQVQGGSLIAGTYYDMDHSPNLSLTMERQYSHSEEIISYNGSSFSNTMGQNTPSAWGNAGAWELHTGDLSAKTARSGRRVWNLEFSFLDSKNIFGSNQMVGDAMFTDSGYDSSDINTDVFKYNLLTDSNWFSQVYHRTLGGTIPFIFQPDNTYSGSDGFAIARIKNNINFKQTAPNYYDVNMVIEEQI